ncbi:MAG: hypothetical protein OXN89_21335 [Bryobacterales bacterium]|nr:hypothetical protein [Bryobacterales bacterium]
MFAYFDPSDLRRGVSRDVFAVLDHDLGRQKLWGKGKRPDFALEVISPSSEVRNRTEKKDLAVRLCKRESFLLQPNLDSYGPGLAGYQLWAGKYVTLPGDLSTGGGLELYSARVAATLRVEGDRLGVRSLEAGNAYGRQAERHA